MKLNVRTIFVPSVIFSFFITAAIASGAKADRLNGAGSSFVYPLMSRWAAEYDKQSGTQVNYQSIGSGGGIQQMTVKTIDFGATDGPMNDEQLQKARETGGDVIHIPLAMGAVAIAYNLKDVKGLKFNGHLISQIYLGKIKKWNDPAISKLNPEINLPDQDISVLHRSDGSGTTYIFADYLSKVSPEWKAAVGLGTSLNWPVGIGQKGNEGVAGQLLRTRGSIGYVELIYALQNNIPFGAVQNKEGAYLEPSLSSVAAAAAGAVPSLPADLRYSITYSSGKDAYPISGTTWAVLYTNQPPDKAKSLADFLRWVTHEGQQYNEGLNYAKLPAGLVQKIDEKLSLIKNAG